MTTLLIKTGLGAGAQFSFDVDTPPRIGEEMIIPQQPDWVLTVCRVMHYPAQNMVVVFTPQHVTPNDKEVTPKP